MASKAFEEKGASLLGLGPGISYVPSLRSPEPLSDSNQGISRVII